MSSEYPQEFLYLLFFAALSGRTFTKSELGIKMKVGEIVRRAETTNLLDAERKGGAWHLRANKATIQWVGEHLNVELPGKNMAVLAILHQLRAKTDAYLKSNHIALAELLQSDRVEADSPVEEIRRAYLKVSSGTYDARVLLKDLRRQLTVPREEQDVGLLELSRTGYADLYPEDDPMSRNEEDDKAALVLADRRRHIIYLSREPRA